MELSKDKCFVSNYYLQSKFSIMAETPCLSKGTWEAAKKNSVHFTPDSSELKTGKFTFSEMMYLSWQQDLVLSALSGIG